MMKARALDRSIIILELGAIDCQILSFHSR